jgi:ABC-type dipeptide/oligopeptide/nickel transport system permease component
MGTFVSAAQQYLLPVGALVLGNCVIFARTTAASLQTTLGGKNADFSRALGLSPALVVLLAMRSSLLPTIAISGQVLAHLFGGVAIIEKVFNWQGLGQWGVDGVLRSDLPVAQGFVVVVAIMAMLSYFAADLLMFAADPRIRQERTAQVATRRARRQAWLASRRRPTTEAPPRPVGATAPTGGEDR